MTSNPNTPPTPPFPLNNLPTNPGVYLYKNNENQIIYIGKAKNLKKRVSQYFNNKKNHSLKTQFLVKNIKDLQTIITNNEIEALLLENKLIKKHKPKYNITLKDSKTYAYIKITADEYPRIVSARSISNKKYKKKKDNRLDDNTTTNQETYFGPFVGGYKRKELMTLAIKLFKLRTCKNLPKKACLNYHIGLCTAPCINKVSKKEYQEQVNNATKFLKGDTKQVLYTLKSKMQRASEELKFEEALELRNQIHSITILDQKQTVDLVKKFDQDIIAIASDKHSSIFTILSIKRGVISGKKEYRFKQGISDQTELLEEFIKIFYSQNEVPNEIIVNKLFWQAETDKDILEEYFSKIKGMKVNITVPQKGEKKKLIQIAEKNAKHSLENSTLKEIQEKLNLPEEPITIECFDISNLGNEHIVAGMTQFKYAKPNKDAYRRFEIQGTYNKQDDFAAMREAVYRRYKRLKEERNTHNDTSFPELIIIDGGPGQLSSALDALKTLSLHIPIISLAKKEEEIYLPNEESPRNFDNNSKMMLLIRKIRDATHNYVISYNKKKRQMKFRKETDKVIKEKTTKKTKN